jgi:isopentenyl diphosphate isomerase/L-lactate dehydrogenase-like FMN-dependent dehydrogenase
LLRWVALFSDPALTWSDLAWLREQTALPILVKGVLHRDDARAALDAGADGIVVSNHGGRQVDGAVGALDCLPAVVDAVHGRVPVLLDSGVRTGADVVKAVALGARAVLVGRPYVLGLALGGEDGVRHVLRCLLAETDLTLALTGCRSLAELTADVLAPAPS